MLNTRQAAQFVGLAVRTLEARRYCGLPPRYERSPSGRIHYNRSDLQAWVKERETNRDQPTDVQAGA